MGTSFSLLNNLPFPFQVDYFNSELDVGGCLNLSRESSGIATDSGCHQLWARP
jgi:hypothetical protein